MWRMSGGTTRCRCPRSGYLRSRRPLLRSQRWCLEVGDDGWGPVADERRAGRRLALDGPAPVFAHGGVLPCGCVPQCIAQRMSWQLLSLIMLVKKHTVA